MLFVSFVWLLVSQPQWRPRFTGIGFSFFALVSVFLFSSLIGVNPFVSFFGDAGRDANALVWIHLGMLFFVFSGMMRSRIDWERMCWVIVCVGGITALIHLLHVLGLNLIMSTKNGSTLGNSSFFGTYLLYMLFFTSWLLLTATKKRRVGLVG